MLFISMIAWYFLSRVLATSAASGLAFRFRLVAGRLLLDACFHLFLLIVGFTLLASVARRVVPLREALALPKRMTARHEWLTGMALGWGMVVAALLPLVLLGRVHAVVHAESTQIAKAALALTVLLVTTLTHELAFRGYPFSRLIDAIGATPAIALVVLSAGVSAWHNTWFPGAAVIGSMLLTLLLSISWLRTHAVWIAWGMHFGLVAFGTVVFGLPVGEAGGFGSLVHSSVFGPDWLTGGGFGPAAALSSLLVILLAIPVLYRLTRDYAWNYTHRPIVAGGHEVGIAPPAVHTAMEQQAPALVQILATTPTSFSATPPSESPERQ